MKLNSERMTTTFDRQFSGIFLTKGLFSAIMILLAMASVEAAEADKTPAGTLCVMTYNLRFGTPVPPNAWPQRRRMMSELIKKISPDVMGTQEGHYAQLNDIAGLTGYDWIGGGCEDGKLKGKYAAVFYRKARLEPMSTNSFWLSDTPDVPGSTTWGNRYPLMATTVKFRDLQTKQEFYVMNTRFNAELEGAQEKSAVLVRQRVEALNTTLPLLLLGDFGSAAGQKVYHQMVDDNYFKDTWTLAKERRGEGLGTLNEFKAIPTDEPRMDWILARGKVSVDTAAIDTFMSEGHFPSDHCPVVTWLRFGE